jgi:hypothetical protein
MLVEKHLLKEEFGRTVSARPVCPKNEQTIQPLEIPQEYLE